MVAFLFCLELGFSRGTRRLWAHVWCVTFELRGNAQQLTCILVE
jgi:hypothetical protein